jgi:hypothetical protein
LIDGYVHSLREAPSDGAARRAAAVLEAKARFDTQIREIFVRVGRDGNGDNGAYFIGLGDPSGQAVEVGASGWSLVDRPRVHFRRPEGLLPLPVPTPGGSIDLLRPYFNLSEDLEFRLFRRHAITFIGTMRCVRKR